jgi:hypothetical protein
MILPPICGLEQLFHSGRETCNDKTALKPDLTESVFAMRAPFGNSPGPAVSFQHFQCRLGVGGHSFYLCLEITELRPWCSPGSLNGCHRSSSSWFCRPTSTARFSSRYLRCLRERLEGHIEREKVRVTDSTHSRSQVSVGQRPSFVDIHSLPRSKLEPKLRPAVMRAPQDEPLPRGSSSRRVTSL